LPPGFLSLGDEGFQRRAVNEGRALVVYWLETVLQPTPDGVAVNAKEFRNFGRIVTRLFDPVHGIAARMAWGFPFRRAHDELHADRREAILWAIQSSISLSTQATQRVEMVTGAGKRPSRI
jgi:hypothetical protein